MTRYIDARGVKKMYCCNCKMIKIIEDEHCRTYHVCTYSQSSCFLQEVGYCGECDLEDEEILGYDYRKGERE